MTIKFCAAAMTCLTLTVGAAGAASWVQSEAVMSCADICADEGASAIHSGQDQFGYTFYVCAAVADNDEVRPGFNIDTSADSANLCLYEQGGGRGQSSDYYCLCETNWD